LEELTKTLAATVAIAIEGIAALLIAIGAIEALFYSFSSLAGSSRTYRNKKDIWVHFAMWLLLALEFELGADIVRSAIAPNWTDIGQLGAIALIRTFLNFFLERDIEKSEAESASRGWPARPARSRRSRRGSKRPRSPAGRSSAPTIGTGTSHRAGCTPPRSRASFNAPPPRPGSTRRRLPGIRCAPGS
jgi:uncharacterized membrane protein